MSQVNSSAAAPHAEAPELAQVITESMRTGAAGRRALFVMRDFGRVGALLSTCVAALPPECPAGEADVRGTLEVAERMLAAAISALEDLHQDAPTA